MGRGGLDWMRAAMGRGSLASRLWVATGAAVGFIRWALGASRTRRRLGHGSLGAGRDFAASREFVRSMLAVNRPVAGAAWGYGEDAHARHAADQGGAFSRGTDLRVPRAFVRNLHAAFRCGAGSARVSADISLPGML